MKKYLLLITASFFLFTACKRSTREINNKLVKEVTEAELLVNSHDSIIQTMLSTELYDSIPKITDKTILELGLKLSEIHRIEVPPAVYDYKHASTLYIESLIRIVKAQNLYTAYNDSITDMEVLTLDSLNIEAVKDAKTQYAKYIEYQKAFSKTDK